jgi:hypothetical protein
LKENSEIKNDAVYKKIIDRWGDKVRYPKDQIPASNVLIEYQDDLNRKAPL